LTGSKRGAIKVDDHSRTSSVENIYAVGDVTDRVNLTPVAIREGHAFADTVFGKQADDAWTTDGVPTAVFSQPEMGTVGLTEAGARIGIATKRRDIYRSRSSGR
jgi:glutathione reductase (NADPH)